MSTHPSLSNIAVHAAGERMNSRAALKTSALCRRERRAIIIKYYSVEKKCSNRGFLNRNKYAAHQDQGMKIIFVGRKAVFCIPAS